MLPSLETDGNCLHRGVGTRGKYRSRASSYLVIQGARLAPLFHVAERPTKTGVDSRESQCAFGRARDRIGQVQREPGQEMGGPEDI